MPRMVDVFKLTEENLFNGDKLIAKILEKAEAEHGREKLESSALESYLIPLDSLSINELVDLVAALDRGGKR